MKKGYSKLVINESVRPNIGGDPQITGLDVQMMLLMSARERGQTEWEELLKEAGFRITGMWTDTAIAYESVIEAELIE
jgi:hypothetical protein